MHDAINGMRETFAGFAVRTRGFVVFRAGVFLAGTGHLLQSRLGRNGVEFDRYQAVYTRRVSMGWTKKISRYGRYSFRFRVSLPLLSRFRVAARETRHTMSDLLRACVAALLSDEDRAKILRIIRKHIPEACCLNGLWLMA